MNKIMVVAPHPDDETLGCGGTLLKLKAEGHSINWMIVTNITEEIGFSKEKVERRNKEIVKVAALYDFDSVSFLDFPTTRLDVISMGSIVQKVGEIFSDIQPDVIYLPYRGDVHTDHAVVFDAVISCTKWFRYPFIKKVMVYETLSETDFSLNTDGNGFRPSIFVNIESYLEKKIEIMSVFQSELGSFPFPRSIEAMRALALVRGAASGYSAAESFMLLRERIE